MSAPDDPHPEQDLPDVRGEPEPTWVEDIRRGRRERAERLKRLLGDDADEEAPERERPS